MKESDELDEDKTNAVKNGDPVTIIVNKAYVPITSADATQNARLADLFANRKTRDIAVLLDFGARAEQEENFIAVWYQRDVPPDEPLSFQDLVVYSQDNWDDRVPPYFRMRLVDVSNERNTRTEELLNQVSSLSGNLLSVVSSPLAGPAMSIATRAAQLALANSKNLLLIDYTFQFYSAAQIKEAGGVPLGQFRKGGILVMGQPYTAKSSINPNPTAQGAGTEKENTPKPSFWENNFQFDFKLRRVLSVPESASPTPVAVDVPYMLATVMTTEAVIPNVVKRRSQQITKVLTDREAVRSELSSVIDEAGKLQKSLQAFKMREDFSQSPSKDSFGKFLDTALANELPDPESAWLLASLRNVTQVNLGSFQNYKEWFDRCGNAVPFEPESRKFNPKGVKDDSQKACD